MTLKTVFCIIGARSLKKAAPLFMITDYKINTKHFIPPQLRYNKTSRTEFGQQMRSLANCPRICL